MNFYKLAFGYTSPFLVPFKEVSQDKATGLATSLETEYNFSLCGTSGNLDSSEPTFSTNNKVSPADTKASKVVSNYYQLYGVQHIKIAPNASKNVTFTLKPEVFQMVNNEGERVFEPRVFTIHVGGSSPMKRSQELGASSMSTGTITLY
ncbi:fibronectin type III-like domain-contianing protein [Flagellimonas marina]|uniref:Fibronectin type III-like domain-contianing protein n=1 Tax=Flagellimonas marina TaxID=1775168 RepID=A0ABV8PNC3_9FLAO